MNTETRPSDSVTEIIQNLSNVGRMWATHGLRVGQSALQTTAKTLEVTATTLSELSDRFARDDE